MNKQEIINWLIENDILIKEILTEVDSYCTKREDLLKYFDENIQLERLTLSKQKIADQIGKSLGLPCEDLYAEISDVELEEYLGQL